MKLFAIFISLVIWCATEALDLQGAYIVLLIVLRILIHS